MRLASWNINSVRPRVRQLRRFLRKYEPDVVCLQETKVEDHLFPRRALTSLGYTYLAIRGQKAYHGVAIASRRPIIRSWSHVLDGRDEARHVAVELAGGLEIHDLYVPAGGDDPRPDHSPKFASKLSFMRAAARWMKRWPPGVPRILVGDLNVAPLETDVWSHQKLKRTTTHTPLEVEHLERMRRSRDWIDAARMIVPPEEKLFTWWSYRAPNFRAANKGRRLDHVWLSPDLGAALTDHRVADEVRGWKRPSDHAPLLVDLDL